jgi:hypothetical protein
MKTLDHDYERSRHHFDRGNLSPLEPTTPRLPRLCAPRLGQCSDQSSRCTDAQRLGGHDLTVETRRRRQTCVCLTFTANRLLADLEQFRGFSGRQYQYPSSL